MLSIVINSLLAPSIAKLVRLFIFGIYHSRITKQLVYEMCIDIEALIISASLMSFSKSLICFKGRENRLLAINKI